MTLDLSVVTVNLNNCIGLEETARSIDAQSTRQRLEWVVQDGASSDASLEIVTAHESSGPTACISEPDRNLYHAMNLGLQRSVGRFVVFLNSGDRFTDSQSAERMVNLLEEGGLPWGYAGVKRLDSSGIVCGYSLPIPYSYAKHMLGMQLLPHQGAVFRRDFIAGLGGYDEAFGPFADQELFIRAACRQRPTTSVDFVATMELAGISSGVSPAALRRYFSRARRKSGVRVLPLFLDEAFGAGLSVFRRGYAGRVLAERASIEGGEERLEA